MDCHGRRSRRQRRGVCTAGLIKPTGCTRTTHQEAWIVRAETIGFIGLGNMGSRIARHLVRDGRDLIGFDVRAETISDSGVRPAASVAEVARQAGLIFLSLPDSRAVEAVILGSDGLLALAHEDQIIVDLSTSAPDSTRRLSAWLAEKGASMLDAGISGGAAAADAGSLTLMVGGDVLVLDQIRDVLALFSGPVFYCGASGAGHTAKVLNNFLNAIAVSATAEVMVAGKKAGLDLQVLLDILNASSGVNFATMNRFPKIIHGDYLEGGLTNMLMFKDLTLYVDLLGRLGVVSPNSAGPLASFGLANNLGYASKISNTVVDAIGDMSGGVRLYDQKDNHS
jgi:3-hydroxyisobutyrate dehydrogenase